MCRLTELGRSLKQLDQLRRRYLAGVPDEHEQARIEWMNVVFRNYVNDLLKRPKDDRHRT